MVGNYTNYKKKAPAGITYEDIVREVNAGVFKPIYYLMGEEPYYIDRVAEFIVSKALTPDEQDFGLTTLYGPETDIGTVISAAQIFPMGTERNVVLVKEAQALKNLDRLEFYLHNMQPTTVLIFCHKNGTIDRRLKVANLINKQGVLFESKKLYEYQLPKFVADYCKRRRVAIEPQAIELIVESVGADLNRLASELDKLIIALPKGTQTITFDSVAKHIGISKNFNVFELQDALVKKDVLKVNRIAKYFDSNPKENPIQMVLPVLFKFFSNLMLAYYSPDKSEDGLAKWLGVYSRQVKMSYIPAMHNYSGVKVLQIISEIRRTDARSKGVGNTSISNGDLMKELLYFILH